MGEFMPSKHAVAGSSPAGETSRLHNGDNNEKISS